MARYRHATVSPSFMLTELDHIPEGMLAAEPSELAAWLSGPTLIHLPGRRADALFVSVLLHGNEPVGWHAMRDLLERYDAGGGEKALPRALSLFIGNVQAAASSRRFLEGQPDFNRSWPGSPTARTEVHATLEAVVEIMERRGVFASVDLHNNTGKNPHYACVNVAESRFLQLATIFSRTVVYFVRPRGVQSLAFARLCPSVTLECGKVGDRSGVERAREFVDACLHLAEIPAHPVARGDLDLYHTVATVRVPPGTTVGFGDTGCDLELEVCLEDLNFRQLPPRTRIGQVRHEHGPLPLLVRDEANRDVFGHYLRLERHDVLTNREVLFSMLTHDEDVIRQDCLGYIMERFPYETGN